MAIINFKEITQAVQTLLKDELKGKYSVQRNAEIESDPNVVARFDAWIGVYRKKVKYDPLTTGNAPWLATPEVDVFIQIADMHSGESAEDKLQDAEQAVMDVLNANRKLKDTVGQTVGYGMEYEIDKKGDVYFHSVLITIRTEARA